LFCQVCLGIWTSEAYECFDLEAKIEAMTNEDYREEVLPTLLGVIVASRAILLQVFGVTTVLSLAVIAVAPSPLFIFDKRLENQLPDLVISWNTAKEMAKKRGFVYPSNNNLTSIGIEKNDDKSHIMREEHQWILFLRAVNIIINESRGMHRESTGVVLVWTVSRHQYFFLCGFEQCVVVCGSTFTRPSLRQIASSSDSCGEIPQHFRRRPLSMSYLEECNTK
jgi:hypothetical protein